MITGKTKLLGVIGDPIEHSLSPIMQNAVLTEMVLDYVYLPFPVRPTDLARALAGFAAIDLQGFNITIPHKQAIIPLLDEVSEVARAIGAVNTVWRTEKGWSGTNTDEVGFLAPLKALNQDWSQRTAVILGNGGAARAVVAGCIQLGCSSIRVIGRDLQKLATFQKSWEGFPQSENLQIHLQQDLSQVLPLADLLVNATPIGMYPQVNASPLSEELMQQIKPNAIAYDLIYTPRPTLFLRQAQQYGAYAIDGLEMLVQQGAAALELWVGQPAPLVTMRQSLLTYLS